jgi:hypothetical protein
MLRKGIDHYLRLLGISKAYNIYGNNLCTGKPAQSAHEFDFNEVAMLEYCYAHFLLSL